MANRTKTQIDANDLDLAMVSLAGRLEDFAVGVEDRGLAHLAKQIRASRLGVRIHMHPQDREATK